MKRKIKPKINAIQLVTDGESELFSVQIRDRDMDNRNFVSVTDKVISSDASASIISRNAIWYVFHSMKLKFSFFIYLIRLSIGIEATLIPANTTQMTSTLAANM